MSFILLVNILLSEEDCQALHKDTSETVVLTNFNIRLSHSKFLVDSLVSGVQKPSKNYKGYYLTKVTREWYSIAVPKLPALKYRVSTKKKEWNYLVRLGGKTLTIFKNPGRGYNLFNISYLLVKHNNILTQTSRVSPIGTTQYTW